MNKKTQRHPSTKLRRCSWLTLLIAGALCHTFVDTNAQNAIPASGATASGSGGTVSYTVGQTAYSSIETSSGSVQQGVQQAYSISTINALPDTDYITLECSVFPNPTADILKLSINSTDFQNLSYSLSTFEGKNIEKGELLENETIIDMGNFNSGRYILSVSNSKSIVKTFKIVKQ